MDFFSTLHTIRCDADVLRKLAAIAELEMALMNGSEIIFDHGAEVAAVGNPTYAQICQIVHGSAVPRRRNLDTHEGRVIFLHALAHIEYSAIDLALDAAYRFRRLPPHYYRDWFKVARDEARHFAMLRALLQELDADYGSLPVHTGIHDAMARSAASLRLRMAATHRHLEANGLDAHEELARKMAQFSDAFAQKITAALKIIYEDEITHVAAGDYWYRYACAEEGIGTEHFRDDVHAAIPGTKFGKKALNIAARKRAGFTDEEILDLQQDT